MARPTIFERILQGELPSHRDDSAGRALAEEIRRGM